MYKRTIFQDFSCIFCLERFGLNDKLDKVTNCGHNLCLTCLADRPKEIRCHMPDCRGSFRDDPKSHKHHIYRRFVYYSRREGMEVDPRGRTDRSFFRSKLRDLKFLIKSDSPLPRINRSLMHKLSMSTRPPILRLNPFYHWAVLTTVENFLRDAQLDIQDFLFATSRFVEWMGMTALVPDQPTFLLNGIKMMLKEALRFWIVDFVMSSPNFIIRRQASKILVSHRGLAIACAYFSRVALSANRIQASYLIKRLILHPEAWFYFAEKPEDLRPSQFISRKGKEDDPHDFANLLNSAVPWKKPTKRPFPRTPVSIWTSLGDFECRVRRFGKSTSQKRRLDVRKSIDSFLLLQKIHFRLKEGFRSCDPSYFRILPAISQFVNPKIMELSPQKWPLDLIQGYHYWRWLSENAFANVFILDSESGLAAVLFQSEPHPSPSKKKGNYQQITFLGWSQVRTIHSPGPGLVQWTLPIFLSQLRPKEELS